MSESEPKVFGGARCARVASFLGKQISRVWIFSVCSDERIPPELELHLRQVCAADLPLRLIILGDFSFIPPERSPASFEAIRLICEAADFQGTIQVCWIDGEMISFSDSSHLHLIWHEFPCENQRSKDHARAIVRPALALERVACSEITQLIGVQPGIRLSDDGSVEALNLTDGRAYQRSLVAGLSKKSEDKLWSLVLRLSNLRELRAGFAGLRAIPDFSELKFLETLDLRGNPQIRLEHLPKTRSLKKLNAAACELNDVPLGIEELLLLRTLLLHKNRIQNVSTVKFPPLLERLSLYRNQIKTGNLDLSNCKELNEINLGANPLGLMSISISDEIKSLTVRIPHVGG